MTLCENADAAQLAGYVTCRKTYLDGIKGVACGGQGGGKGGITSTKQLGVILVIYNHQASFDIYVGVHTVATWMSMTSRLGGLMAGNPNKYLQKPSS